MSILITGGAGFIGSHTAVEFLNAGYEIIIVDNYCNSSPKSIERVKQITGKDFKVYEVDMCDKEALEAVFQENPDIDSAIHFAGLKAVGESVQLPGLYYYNNLLSTLNLLELMAKYDAKRIVFSSSATVYGAPKSVPIREDFDLSATNPYGQTKLMIEKILKDFWISDNSWSISILRYFYSALFQSHRCTQEWIDWRKSQGNSEQSFALRCKGCRRSIALSFCVW